MSTSNRLLILALLSSILCACATSPTGRHQLMLVSEESSIASSKQAYLSTVKQLDNAGKLEDNWVINKRIDVITGQLITEAIKMRPDTSDWEWSVVVIDEPETINAWCMAGGRMAIYTGLLIKVDPTDDELAQVMAHEISHALAKHTAEKMSRQIATSVGVVAVGVVADNSAIALSGAALTAMLAVNLPGSRAAEKEADRMGIELAAKAGFNPTAAVTLWEKMAAASKSGTPQFMSTHPDPENRQSDLVKLEPTMKEYYFPYADHPIYPLD